MTLTWHAGLRTVRRPGTEHLALALLASSDGLVPPILSALGVSAPALRAAILDRCRQASVGR
jgi:hypothetical protein